MILYGFYVIDNQCCTAVGDMGVGWRSQVDHLHCLMMKQKKPNPDDWNFEL